MRTGRVEHKQLAALAFGKKQILDAYESLAGKTRSSIPGDAREFRRRVLVDGDYEGEPKRAWVARIVARLNDQASSLERDLLALDALHAELFDRAGAGNLMIRHVADPAYRAFGTCETPKHGIAALFDPAGESVQAFPAILEAGRNARGYIHKLESHDAVVEYVYGITDHVFGVMAPQALRYEENRVVADPSDAQLFYVRAGEMVSIDPLVLHTGSLSVDADGHFAVMIAKRTVDTGAADGGDLPPEWHRWQERLRIAPHKFFLTLEELQEAAGVPGHPGYVGGREPIRLVI